MFSKPALPQKPFSLQVHFLYTVTLLGVICSVSIVKLFSLVDLSSELPFLPLWAFPPPPPPRAFVHVIRQIRGPRFGRELVQILLGQQVHSQWWCSLIARYNQSISILGLSLNLCGFNQLRKNRNLEERREELVVACLPHFFPNFEYLGFLIGSIAGQNGVRKSLE